MNAFDVFVSRGARALAIYLAIYAAFFALLVRFELIPVAEPLVILLVVGGGFSLVAWLGSRTAEPLSVTVERPREELAAMLAMYLLLVAVVTWGFPTAASQFASERSGELAKVALKLIAFVVIPMFVIARVGGRSAVSVLSSGNLRHRGHAMAVAATSTAVFLFQIFFGQGASAIARSGFGVWKVAILTLVALMWLALEVGIVEEFFFRTLLQARLAVALKSEGAAIVVASVLFGLMHAPGLYLRSAMTQEGVGIHPTALMAIGYSIVVTSVAGFFLGVLWSRTRNLTVVVLVHAAADLVPNFMSTVRLLFP